MKNRLYKSTVGLVTIFFLAILLRVVQYSQPLAENSEKALSSNPITLNSAELEQAGLHLSKALSIRTVTNQADAEFLQLHDLLARVYAQAHLKLKRRIINKHSLLYHWPGSDQTLKPVIYLAHLDVVPVTPEESKRWQHAPFSGYRDQDFIWGRGALDDKSAVIGLFEAVNYLLRQGFKPRRSIYFAFGHDEESGGQHGAKVIAQYLQLAGVNPLMLFDEWSGVLPGAMLKVNKPIALLAVAEKGVMNIRLSVVTSTGHSSRPPRRTAIDILSQALVRLNNHPIPSRLVEPTRTMFRQLAPEMNWLNRVVIANTWLFESMLLRQLDKKAESRALVSTSFATTLFKSGQVANQLPLSASAVINVRLLPGTSTSKVLAHIKKIINNPGVHIATVGEISEPSAISSSKSSSYRRVKKSINQVFADAIVVPGLLIGTTDSRHYRKLAAPVYRFRGLRLNKSIISQMHGVNERISRSNLANMIKLYIRLMQNLDPPD